MSFEAPQVGLSARAYALALRMLSGAGAASVDAYRLGECLEFVAHGMTSAGELVLAASPVAELSRLADAQPAEVRLDIVKHTPDPSVSLVAASLHVLGSMTWVESVEGELPERVASLADTVKKLERELADAKKALALAGPGQAAEVAPEQLGDVPFLGRVIDDLDPKELRGLLDEEKQRHGSGVFAIVATRDGRASIAVSVSADLAGKANAVDLVRAGVAALGGQGGGGRPDMAQGGGPDGGAADAAVAAVKAALAA